MDLKSEILKILIAFDEYCNKNHIRYVLGYGTLLGAVRHKGFIPWDDDIDVLLTVDEYEKLKEAAKKQKYLDEQKRYRVAVPGDKDYYYSYIKIVDEKYKIAENNIADRYQIGLFVDAFRMDYWPDSSLKVAMQMKMARLLLRLNEICIRGNLQKEKFRKLDKWLKPVDVLYKALGLKTEYFVKRIERIGMNNKKSSYMGNIMAASGRRNERVDASIFNEITYLPFEGIEFPVPKQYDFYLKTVYGDYMTIPDKEHQDSHDFKIVSIDEKFT